ncbi:unnamed protein product [Discula destructiva]
MTAVLIVGGYGQVARLITKQLVATEDTSYTVYSLIRNPAQVPEIERLGGVPVVQDLEQASVSELLTTLSRVKPAVVIWAAGAGYRSTPDRIDAVDHQGAVKIFDALAIASKAGECGKRLISISALDIRDREHKPVPDWYNEDDRMRSVMIWNGIGLFLSAKFKADKELRTGNGKRGLEYTMVRPGGLSNDPGVGVVNAGKVHLGQMVTREDVAQVVVACIREPDIVDLAFDVVGGPDPIIGTVKKIGANRIDTFEGYY